MSAISDKKGAQLPAAVLDFVFDLHDVTRRSHRQEEMKNLYSQTFPDLCNKYFGSEEWPEAEAISGECDGDLMFLGFYKELKARHYHTHLRPSLSDKISHWKIYTDLFDLILRKDDGLYEGGGGEFHILPEWAFEIMHEFVYQFQGFCQLRSQLHAKSGSQTITKQTTENLQILTENKDAWAVETVMYYLSKLIATSNIKEDNSGKLAPGQTHHLLGYFAAVSLSRLECLLGDYSASVESLSHVDVFSKSELFSPLFACKLSIFYHLGISYFVNHRFKDCVKIFQVMCLSIQKGLQTGQLKKLFGYDQFQKLNEKMITVLAIVYHVCPSIKIEESLVRLIVDKYAEKFAKIDAAVADPTNTETTESYEDLLGFCVPKFVSPTCPDYSKKTTKNICNEAYKQQIRLIANQIKHYQSLPKLRSYLKLYTSIGVQKLAGFNDVDEDTFLNWLLTYKNKSLQPELAPRERREKDAGLQSVDELVSGVSNVALSDKKEIINSVIDIQYYVDQSMMIHVFEEVRERNYDRYFVAQIQNLEEIYEDVKGININI